MFPSTAAKSSARSPRRLASVTSHVFSTLAGTDRCQSAKVRQHRAPSSHLRREIAATASFLFSLAHVDVSESVRRN
ncbi:hypothetical protein MRX96_030197 [Rhipicephalus microplus]